jgi:hypothetical protein
MEDDPNKGERRKTGSAYTRHEGAVVLNIFDARSSRTKKGGAFHKILITITILHLFLAVH